LVEPATGAVTSDPGVDRAVAARCGAELAALDDLFRVLDADIQYTRETTIGHCARPSMTELAVATFT
jgi:hypothetical protein